MMRFLFFDTFQLEINCKFVKALAKNGRESTDVNERTITSDCVVIWLILQGR